MKKPSKNKNKTENRQQMYQNLNQVTDLLNNAFIKCKNLYVLIFPSDQG